MATILTFLLSLSFLPLFPTLDNANVPDSARNRGQVERNLDLVQFDVDIPDSVRTRGQVDNRLN